MAVSFGYSFGIKIEDFGGFVPVLAYCPTAIPPCSGKTPCINTCGCQKDQMLLPSGECQDHMGLRTHNDSGNFEKSLGMSTVLVKF